MVPNTLYKHGIIVAAVSILASLSIILVEITMVKYETEDTNGSVYPHVVLICAASLQVLSAGLMIFGIIKKRPLFMLPWLILMSLASVPYIIATFTIFVHLSSYHYNGFLVFLVFTGFNVIILHPIYGLFVEMRMENIENFQSIEDNISNK